MMTDADPADGRSLDMAIYDVPELTHADRLDKGIVIKFSDGKCGFYSNDFLYSKLPESELLDETDVAW